MESTSGAKSQKSGTVAKWEASCVVAAQKAGKLAVCVRVGGSVCVRASVSVHNLEPHLAGGEEWNLREYVKMNQSLHIRCLQDLLQIIGRSLQSGSFSGRPTSKSSNDKQAAFMRDMAFFPTICHYALYVSVRLCLVMCLREHGSSVELSDCSCGTFIPCLWSTA